MIAQLLAIRHPDRVLSLVSIMSSTGNRRVGQPHPRVALRMLRRAPRDRDGYIESHLDTYRADRIQDDRVRRGAQGAGEPAAV